MCFCLRAFALPCSWFFMFLLSCSLLTALVFSCFQKGTARIGQAEQNTQNWTGRTILPGKDCNDRAAKTGPGQDCQDRIPIIFKMTKAGQTREDSQKRTAKTLQPEQDSQKRAGGVRPGQVEQGCQQIRAFSFRARRFDLFELVFSSRSCALFLRA